MPWTRDEMAARAARELKDGFYVNLGIGIPTLVANHIPAGVEVTLQSENGMLGIGPFPYRGRGGSRSDQRRQADRSELPSTSFFSSADSFAMIRGGHIDLAVLGAMEISRGRRHRQLDDPRQDGQGHGRRDGSGRGRQEDHRGDGPRRQGRQPEVHPRLHAAADRQERRRHDRDRILRVPAGDHDSPFRLVELAPGVTADEVADKVTALYQIAV